VVDDDDSVGNGLRRCIARAWCAWRDKAGFELDHDTRTEQMLSSTLTDQGFARMGG